MRLLIVYASREGHTAKIARRIFDVAGETPNVEVTLAEVGEVLPNALTNCNAVIIAASVHFDRHPRAIVRFVRDNLAWLRAHRSAFLSVSGASMTPAGRQQAEDYVTDFLDETRWSPDRHELVAGAMPFTKYGLLIRFIIKRIAKAKGLSTDTKRDHEYTDWAALDRFARTFVARAVAA
jgi:menaquinone-dependent protoporphyrinogen oxidase